MIFYQLTCTRFFYSTKTDPTAPPKLGIIRPTTEITATTTNEYPYRAMSLTFLPLKSDLYHVMIVEPSGKKTSIIKRKSLLMS